MTFPSANILQLKKRKVVHYSDDIPDGDHVPGQFDVIRSAAIEVSNDDVLQYFTDRATYIGNPKPHIGGSTEYLTGTYQQPDFGTYPDDINDLTETQITNLAAGNDYTGTGTNVIWSTLEKVWILENLDTTSTSGVLRYRFSFTYDSGTQLAVLNSGALGIPETLPVRTGVLNGGGEGETDWANPTDGLAQYWTEINTGLTASIVTGNGFTGNAQRIENTDVANAWYVVSDLFAAEVGVRNRLSFKYRGNAPDTGSDDAKPNVEIYNSSNGTILRLSLATNTGNALYYEADFIATTSTIRVKFRPSYSNPVLNEYIELDEINVSKVAVGDWVDSDVDGLADNWIFTDDDATPSIVTGNGFIGNAQKFTMIANGTILIDSENFNVTNGNDYILSLRFLNPTILATTLTLSIFVLNSIDTQQVALSLLPFRESGTGIVVQSESFTVDDSIVYIKIISSSTDNIGEEYIFDEIELIEI